MKNNKPTFDLKQRINTALSLSTPAVKMQGGVNSIPTFQNSGGVKIEYPKTTSGKLRNIEKQINKDLGKPMLKAFKNSTLNYDVGMVDNVRHTLGGMYTSQAIQDKFPDFVKVTGLPQAFGVLGANVLGLSHEVMTLLKDQRPWLEKGIESSEDMLNNFIGSLVSVIPLMSEKDKKDVVWKLSMNNLLPDGIYEGIGGDDVYINEDEKKSLNKSLYSKNPQVKTFEGGMLPDVIITAPRKKQGGTIQEGGTVNRLQQMMGYKDNSPYKNLPYQDIYSDRITMQGVSRPLIAKTDTGVTTVMQPGEEYYFPGASRVREIPMYKNGGELKDRENFQQMKQNTYINPLTRQLGKSIRKFQNSGNVSPKKENKVVEWDKNGTAKGNFVLSNEAEIGSTIKLKDPNTGQTIEAKVVGRIPEGVYDKNTKIVMSPDLGKTLKLDTRGANDTAISRVNLEAEYTPIPTPSQPAAENANQQANTQPPAQNTPTNNTSSPSFNMTGVKPTDNNRNVTIYTTKNGVKITRDARGFVFLEKDGVSTVALDKSNLFSNEYGQGVDVSNYSNQEIIDAFNAKGGDSYIEQRYKKEKDYQVNLAPYGVSLSEDVSEEGFIELPPEKGETRYKYRYDTTVPDYMAYSVLDTQNPGKGWIQVDPNSEAYGVLYDRYTDYIRNRADKAMFDVVEKAAASNTANASNSQTGGQKDGASTTTTPPATSTAPAADDYTVLESEAGDPYEYRYNEKTGKYETRKKGSSSWIVLDDSTDRLKEARKAIEGRYGEQVKKVQEETAKSSAAPVGTTGTGTGTGAGTDSQGAGTGAGAGVATTQNPPAGLIVNPIEARIRAWRGGAAIQNPSTPTQQGTGTGTSTGTSTQGSTSGTTPPSTNTPSGSTVIPPSSIRRSEIREFPGRIFDPIPEEQDRTVPGLKDRNPIMRELPYEILEPDMPGNQGSVGQGGTSGATDKRDPVNIPTLPTSPLKPINPFQSSSASIPTPTVKDNAVRIGNVDFSKANASDNNSSDFQGWYGAGNKTFYQTEDGTIKIVTDGRGRFYLENENQLFEVDPPDSTDVKGSIKGERYYDDEQKDFVEKPNSYDDYWKSQLAYIKKNQKKGIPSKEFYGKKRANDYGSWDYRKGSFLQGGPIRAENIDQAKVGKFLKGIGNTLSDYGRGMVDGFGNWTGTFDLENSGYKTKFGRSFSDVADTLTSTTGKIGRTVANKFVPGLGSAAGALGNITGYGNQNTNSAMQQPMPQQANALSNLQMFNQLLGAQGQGGIMSMLAAPTLGNYQEGAQVQQPQPAIYTEDFVPGAYKTGLDKVSLTGTPYVPTELKMTPLSTPVSSSSNSSNQGLKTITIYDKDTNRPRRIYVDNTGKMLGYADNKEDLYNQSFEAQKEKHNDLYRLSQQWRNSIQPAISKEADNINKTYTSNSSPQIIINGVERRYDSLTPEELKTIEDKMQNDYENIEVIVDGKKKKLASLSWDETKKWKESIMPDYEKVGQWLRPRGTVEPPVPQQQQGGPIITSMLYRNMDRNNSIKNNISVNKTKLQDVINLSNKVNPYRLYPGGVYKNGGMIMEGGVSASRAGFSRQPITGASSTGPLGPKRTETPDYTNKGARLLMDLPSNEYVPTDNLIPIQTEIGEMIVLPTGDLMPVMARKRHHQMQDDEVTDVTPENSYILSAHGQVRINRNEADLLITETGVKPYRLGQAQNPPTEKTLGSIMTKSIMKPAEVAKRINSLFPVLSSSNPFEIAANVENKINRKPYLEGLIQLSELDKYRKGLSEPAMSDMQQQQMQMQGQGSPMLARQGGRTISRPGIVRAQGGGTITLPSLPTPGLNSKFLESMYPSQITLPSVGYSPGYFDAREQNIAATRSRAGLDGGADSTGMFTGIFAPANFAARMIGAQALRGAEKRGITRERDIYGRSFNKMGSLMGLGTGLEAAMLGAQDPFVKYTETPDTYIRTMQTQTPSQLLEAQASSAYSNLPDYSQMGAAGLGAQNAAYAQGLAASSRFLGEAAERDRANFNRQQELLQANMAQNVAGRLAAQRATDAAVNKMLSGYGNLANRYTQGLVDLTGQRMGADLGLSRAEQASKVGLYGNRLNAFTTLTGDIAAGGEDLLKFYGLGK